MKQWNSNCGTLWGQSGTLMVECVGAQWNSKVEQCGRTEEQSWWNSVVEKWNSHRGTVWWNRGTVMVQQCGGTIEQSWWNSGTLVVEHCNETVEQ